MTPREQLRHAASATRAGIRHRNGHLNCTGQGAMIRLGLLQLFECAMGRDPEALDILRRDFNLTGPHAAVQFHQILKDHGVLR